MPEQKKRTAAQTEAAAEDNFSELYGSMRQPVWHLIVLYVVTQSVYFFYWCYKTWRDMSAYKEAYGAANKTPVAIYDPRLTVADRQLLSASSTNSEQEKSLSFSFVRLSSFRNCSAVLRTVVLCAPVIIMPLSAGNEHAMWFVLGLKMLAVVAVSYLFASLIFGICRLEPLQSNFAGKHPVIATTLVVFSFVLLTYLANLQGALFFLFYLAVVPVCFVQHWLNRFWETVEDKDKRMRQVFTIKETIVIVCGAMILGLTIVGTMLGLATK